MLLVVGVLGAPLFQAFYSPAYLTSLYISIPVSSFPYPASRSLRLSCSRFFSAIKIYAHSCSRCVHIAFRLARCSFCAGLRTRPASRLFFSALQSLAACLPSYDHLKLPWLSASRIVDIFSIAIHARSSPNQRDFSSPRLRRLFLA